MVSETGLYVYTLVRFTLKILPQCNSFAAREVKNGFVQFFLDAL